LRSYRFIDFASSVLELEEADVRLTAEGSAFSVGNRKFLGKFRVEKFVLVKGMFSQSTVFLGEQTFVFRLQFFPKPSDPQ
jgi:hypothetical protein